ncbi:hypothetical protein VCHA53O466_40168 [Vibrio chagasii]|nr:hypothetical protein VCHA53O466_40168 [Vibrio chagasii]
MSSTSLKYESNAIKGFRGRFDLDEIHDLYKQHVQRRLSSDIVRHNTLIHLIKSDQEFRDWLRAHSETFDEKSKYPLIKSLASNIEGITEGHISSTIELAGADPEPSPTLNSTPPAFYKAVDGWEYNKSNDSYQRIGESDDVPPISFDGTNVAKVRVDQIPNEIDTIEQVALGLIDRGVEPIYLYPQPHLSKEDNQKIEVTLKESLEKHGYKGEVLGGSLPTSKVRATNTDQPQKSKKEIPPAQAIQSTLNQFEHKEDISCDEFNSVLARISNGRYQVHLTNGIGQKEVIRRNGGEGSYLARVNVLDHKINGKPKVRSFDFPEDMLAGFISKLGKKVEHQEYAKTRVQASLVNMLSTGNPEQYLKESPTGVTVDIDKLKQDNIYGASGLTKIIIPKDKKVPVQVTITFNSEMVKGGSATHSVDIPIEDVVRLLPQSVKGLVEGLIGMPESVKKPYAKRVQHTHTQGSEAHVHNTPVAKGGTPVSTNPPVYNDGQIVSNGGEVNVGTPPAHIMEQTPPLDYSDIPDHSEDLENTFQPDERYQVMDEIDSKHTSGNERSTSDENLGFGDALSNEAARVEKRNEEQSKSEGQSRSPAQKPKL